MSCDEEEAICKESVRTDKQSRSNLIQTRECQGGILMFEERNLIIRVGVEGGGEVDWFLSQIDLVSFT